MISSSSARVSAEATEYPEAPEAVRLPVEVEWYLVEVVERDEIEGI